MTWKTFLLLNYILANRLFK